MKQYVKTYRYSSNVTTLPFLKMTFNVHSKILSRKKLEKNAEVSKWMESIEVE